MTIPVLFCIDGAFWQHVAVSIASLLENNARNTFRIFVASVSEMDGVEVTKLKSMIERKGSCLETIVYSQATNYHHLPTHSHLTFAMYLRLFMTEYIDHSLDKILYLDSDIIICSDIEELWSFSLGDAYVGAAREPYNRRQREPLGFSPTDLYVNSGVMLVNLKQWRADQVLPRLLDFAERNQAIIHSPDQDTINSVFRGRICDIGYQWNWQALFPRFAPAELGLDRETFASLRLMPKLVHYTSKYKPWFYRWQPHYKEIYYKYLAQTPWAVYEPPDRSFANFPLRSIRRLQRAMEWHLPSFARALRNLKAGSDARS
ncbi:glycosyltransferase family 8 protein [Alloacidobacterium dinghuense]|uniref:Glycosyltransferase family 8 protein n=1 Tax=Alloacidobacterium dinghuense TaxID=2763107 RepID=A0A7G8BI82_9BACT|nr:glycosyltransferase family 8 protein [Alloacidobacterium dinghuense]QNI32252.1 glycosyltransferase family 8 protein [Alloacidobacterium dinghuense]